MSGIRASGFVLGVSVAAAALLTLPGTASAFGVRAATGTTGAFPPESPHNAWPTRMATTPGCVQGTGERRVSGGINWIPGDESFTAFALNSIEPVAPTGLRVAGVSDESPANVGEDVYFLAQTICAKVPAQIRLDLGGPSFGDQTAHNAIPEWGSVKSKCPPGERALGAGLSWTGNVTADLNTYTALYVSELVPQVKKGRVVGFRISGAGDETGPDASGYSFAPWVSCSASNALNDLKVRSKLSPKFPGQTPHNGYPDWRSLKVKCKQGEKALAGGLDWKGANATVGALYISELAALTRVPDFTPRGFRVTGVSDEDPATLGKPIRFRGYALCL